MPPNQNQYPAPLGQGPNDQGHDPYAFFMDPQKAPKRSLLGGGSNKKLGLIAGSIVGLIILVVFLASLSSGGGKNAGQLVTLAQTQQEVIRVAKDGAKNAQAADLKNFATTTMVTLSSDQRLLLADFAKSGKKVSPKTLAQGANPQTTQALAAAQAANTYDSTFATTMDSELKSYIDQLNGVAQTAGPSSAKLLKEEADDAGKLRKNLAATSTAGTTVTVTTPQ